MNEDKGTRYRRAERALRTLEVVACATALTGVALSGLARTVAARVSPVFAPSAVLASTALVAVVCMAPFAIRRRGVLARRYGLPVASPARVLRSLVNRGIVLVATVTAAWFVFQRASVATGSAAGLVTAVVLVAVAGVAMLVAPWLITLSPRIRPVRDEALTGRLHALASRAQIRLAGLHEWLSGRDDEPNAALIGVVGRRRLLVSESLIVGSPPEEIDAVVAHELGHHVHGHTERRVRQQALALVIACLAAQVVAWCSGAFGATAGTTDPASLPWMLWGGGVAWLATRPWRLALSRRHEAEADAFALSLTGQPDVLARVLARVGERSLASGDESPFTRAFFLTHPPIPTRIAAARAIPRDASSD